MALKQPVERGHVIRHRPFRRRHDGRRPGHDVVAREDEIASGEREDEMVAGVAGRGDRLHLPAVAGDERPVGERRVRHEIPIDSGIRQRRAFRGGATAPAGMARRAGLSGKALDAAGVVAMGVGDQDVGHGLAGRRRHQRPKMGFVVGPRIDDGHPAGAQDVAVGAGEGERAGIRRRDPAHAGCNRHRPAVLGLEVAMEDEISHRCRPHRARRTI